MEILISEDEIAKKITKLAGQISEDYSGKEIDVICLINGASFFCADLSRKITAPVRIHFFGFTSYTTPNDTGEVKITNDIAEALNGKHILIVEGIVVSGRTPKFVYEYFRLREPASIEYCAVGIKPNSLSVDLNIKYYAFEFESDLIVGGYGIGRGIEKSLPYLIRL